MRKMSLAQPVVAVFMLLSAMYSQADDRALLIGVGQYADANANLNGIDLDVNIMNRVARNIGFDESSIKVIQDEEATLANVDTVMGTWLVDGVQPQDRVLIYFSGHGTQLEDENADEEDGVDEALAMHDMGYVNGKLEGVLLDDRFYELLKQIPSQNVFVIVDACHSGTGYRALKDSLTGASQAQAKSYRYPGIPARIEGGFTAAAKEEAPENFAALMAAADDEQSLATQSGSLFTVALGEAIDNAVKSGQSVTLRDLKNSSTGVIQSALADSSPEMMFTPQVNGAKRLVDMPLQVLARPSRRDELLELASAHPGVEIRASKEQFALGDLTLTLSVTVPHAGYLNIVAINPEDQPVVLYPNAFNPENAVSGGVIKLPTAEMAFDFKAARPVGESAFVAFLSNEPVDLFATGLGEQDDQGGISKGLLAKLSAFGARNIEIAARDKQLKAGSTLISVVE